MNCLEHIVTNVLSEPYFKEVWCVDVEADCYGRITKTTAYFKTRAEAEAVVEGYQFVA
jgi:hypothetical protein